MVRYDHLVGRTYEFGTQDCYHLLRDFFRDNFGIQLKNYAYPMDFWKGAQPLNLYMDLYHDAGFEPLDVHPVEWQPGDVFLIAIQSLVANHAAILVENGKMLHHLWGQRSIVEAYSGSWRNRTLSVLRHRDVPDTREQSTEEISQYLSPRALRDSVPREKLKAFLTPGPERVGFILKSGEIVEVENVCNEPEEGFEVNGEDLLKWLPEAEATWHTHPDKSSNLSVEDHIGFRNFPELKHYIVGTDGVRCYAVERGVVVHA